MDFDESLVLHDLKNLCSKDFYFKHIVKSKNWYFSNILKSFQPGLRGLSVRQHFLPAEAGRRFVR
ncbi:hypothetical protein AALU65_11835, partial [Akkermansia muciniphila]|uniref:hypothetical protein n=1 Tax=Akkermansia muciniphila TaxID=239935 RepID=UPI0035175C66